VPERQCRAGSDRVNVEGAKQHGADDGDPDGTSDALHRADHSTGCASVRRLDRRDDEIGIGRNEQAATDPGDQKRTAHQRQVLGCEQHRPERTEHSLAASRCS